MVFQGLVLLTKLEIMSRLTGRVIGGAGWNSQVEGGRGDRVVRFPLILGG